jgi:hypothetical protein
MRRRGVYKQMLHLEMEYGNSKGLENYEHSTFRAVCFLTSSFDLNITADKLIVTKKPSSFHTQISQS